MQLVPYLLSLVSRKLLFSFSFNSKLIFRIEICCGRVDTAVWMHYLDAKKTAGEEARRQLHKNIASNIEQVLASTPHKAPTPHKASTIRPPASHHENYPS